MKKGMRILATLAVLVCIPLMLSAGDRERDGRNRKSDVRYFSRNSFYIYAMGSTNSFDPPDYLWDELGWDTGSGFAPVLGFGFRFLNMGNRFFLNGEFDFSPVKYDLALVPDQKVNFYTLMLNGEGLFFGARGLSLYFGIGVSFAQVRDMFSSTYWSGAGNETITTMALEMGLKFPVTRSLFVRSGLRWMGEVYPGETWYDEYGFEFQDDSSFDRLNTAFTFGLEFHF